MTEDRQGAVHEEGELGQAVQPPPPLETPEQVDEEDALPHLHDLAVGLTVASPGPEAFVNTQRVRGIEGPRPVTRAPGEPPRRPEVLVAACVLIRTRRNPRCRLEREQHFVRIAQRGAILLIEDQIVERLEEFLAERVLRGAMISRHHVAPWQRGIYRRAVLRFAECDGIDGTLFVEPVEFREVHEHAGDGEVADPRSRVAVANRIFLCCRRWRRRSGASPAAQPGPRGPSVHCRSLVRMQAERDTAAGDSGRGASRRSGAGTGTRQTPLRTASRYALTGAAESMENRSTWMGTTYGLERVLRRMNPRSWARRMLRSKSAKS